MARTRAGLLDGALRAVAQLGARRATMLDIAAHAGVAKATLYNHFRTKDDVWAALVEAEVCRLAEECAVRPLADALAHAADRISAHPALTSLVRSDPAALAALVAEDLAGAGWRAARTAIRRQLAAAGLPDDPGTEDLVLRWLASYVATPGDPMTIRVSAAALAAGLRVAASGAAEVSEGAGRR